MTDILWVPAPEAFNVRPDPNIAPIAATTPLLPGATVTAVPGGLVWDIPAQNIASGAGTFGARAVFHIDPPVPVLTPSDDRSYRVVCDVLAEGTGGSPTTAIPQIALLAAATEAGVAYTYVNLKETLVNYPSTGRAFERLWSDFATVTPLAFYLTTPAVADWFANPLSLVVTMTASTVMGAVDVPAMRLTVTNVRLEMLDAAGPPPTPPAAVRYRDPADGQFKPLSQIGARGYPAEAPDYSTAAIRFVDHPLTTGAAAVGTVPGGWQQPDKPSEAGGTVTAVEGGMRYQMNAPGGGTDYYASAEVLIVPPLPITHGDDRTYSFVSTAAVASWNANGGMWSMNLYLVSDGGSANIGTVQQAGGDVRPSQPIPSQTLKAIMDGANLRVRAMVTVSVFSGVAPAFVADVTLTNFRLHAQEVVAP